MASARDSGSLPPPRHILNAPTRLMKDEGYGEGYAYDHNAPEGFSGQNYFPEGMGRERYYRPTGRGYEAELAERLARFQRLREGKGE
jgi:putative ATPase